MSICDVGTVRIAVSVDVDGFLRLRRAVNRIDWFRGLKWVGGGHDAGIVLGAFTGVSAG